MKKQTFIIIFLTIFLIPLVSADFCGNNIIEFGETCGYPSTFNNLFCSQSTTACSGFLTGTRDAFGNCNSICGCEEDDFNFQCVKNSCGAECAVNVDCPKTNCDYLNKCYDGTYREYRSIFNTCSNSCACTQKTCEEMIEVFVYNCDEITNICYIVGGPYIEIITDNDQDGYDTECDNDCNDGNSNIHPEAIELCDGIDNDCGGQTDEGCVHNVGLRADYDGFGHIIKLNDPDNNPIAEDTPVVDCVSGYDIMFLTDNLGDFIEDVEINLTIQNSTNIVYHDSRVRDGLGIGESTSTGRKHNFIFNFDEGLYEILVNSIIKEDDNLLNNFASRQINIDCPDCFADDDCDDSDDYTKDDCINPGNIESYCEHLPIACLNNLDCGVDDYISESYCLSDDVYEDYKEFTCNSPGTVRSSCSSETNPKFIESCNYGCENGVCLECEDNDNDGVCNKEDSCPNSRPEEVDQNGCDIIQFCSMQAICGPGCDLADWKDNEEGNPRDCVTVMTNREGKLYPTCTGLNCAD